MYTYIYIYAYIYIYIYIVTVGGGGGGRECGQVGCGRCEGNTDDNTNINIIIIDHMYI